MINPPKAVGVWRSPVQPDIQLIEGSVPDTYKLVVPGAYMWLRADQIFAVAELLVNEIARRAE